MAGPQKRFVKRKRTGCQALRAAATSARCCSLATSVFFSRQPKPGHHLVQRAVADRHAVLGAYPGAQLQNRVITVCGHPSRQRVFEPSELWHRVVALLARRVQAEPPAARARPAHIRLADPKAGSNLSDRARRGQYLVAQVLPIGLSTCHAIAATCSPQLLGSESGIYGARATQASAALVSARPLIRPVGCSPLAYGIPNRLIPQRRSHPANVPATIRAAAPRSEPLPP